MVTSRTGYIYIYFESRETSKIFHYSFSSLLSIASFESSSPPRAIQFFLFQFIVPSLSLKDTNSCLPLFPYLPVTSNIPSIFPSVTCFRKAVPTQYVTNPVNFSSLFLMFVGYTSPPWLWVKLFLFSHDRPKWSSPSFSSTTIQNFQEAADLLHQVFKSQHHTKLCSKCRFLLLFPHQIYIPFAGERKFRLYCSLFILSVPTYFTLYF